jgi:hypothetical protein
MIVATFLFVLCAAAAPGLVTSRLSTSTSFDLPLDDDDVRSSYSSSSAYEQHVHVAHREDLKHIRERETQDRLQRTQEQRERAREMIARMMKSQPPNVTQLVALTKEEMELYATTPQVNEQPWLQRALSSSGSGAAARLASPGTSYEPWQQAYRTLGAFIDCDHTKYSTNDRHNYGYTNNGNACARWMMWASVRFFSVDTSFFDSNIGSVPTPAHTNTNFVCSVVPRSMLTPTIKATATMSTMETIQLEHWTVTT